nr:hypothetical protein [Mycoplasmopsis bovis]
MHPKRFLVIIPIVIFSAIIELINVPLLSLADYSTTGASQWIRLNNNLYVSTYCI